MRGAFSKRDTRTRYTVNFDPACESAIREIEQTLCRRWRLTSSDQPSTSLLIGAIVRAYAESVRQNPVELQALREELKVRGANPVGSRRRALAVKLAEAAATNRPETAEAVGVTS